LVDYSLVSFFSPLTKELSCVTVVDIEGAELAPSPLRATDSTPSLTVMLADAKF